MPISMPVFFALKTQTFLSSLNTSLTRSVTCVRADRVNGAVADGFGQEPFLDVKHHEAPFVRLDDGRIEIGQLETYPICKDFVIIVVDRFVARNFLPGQKDRHPLIGKVAVAFFPYRKYRGHLPVSQDLGRDCAPVGMARVKPLLEGGQELLVDRKTLHMNDSV